MFVENSVVKGPPTVTFVLIPVKQIPIYGFPILCIWGAIAGIDLIKAPFLEFIVFEAM